MKLIARHTHGLDLLGAGVYVVGFFDLGKERHKMDALKPVTVGIARAIVVNAKEVITKAIAAADARGLPGPTQRKLVKDHLQWHQDKLVAEQDPMAMYAPGNDLKEWALRAFEEANAVEEGAEWVDGAWSRMWDEITRELAKLPAKIREGAKAAIGNVTGIPWWVWATGGTVVVGLLGFTAYKIVTGPVGAAAASAYLGGRR